MRRRYEDCSRHCSAGALGSFKFNLETPYDPTAQKSRIGRCRLLADGRLCVEHEKVISVCTPRLYCGHSSPAEDEVSEKGPLFSSARLRYDPSCAQPALIDEGVKHVKMECGSESDQMTRGLMPHQKEEGMYGCAKVWKEPDTSSPASCMARLDPTLVRNVRESCLFVAVTLLCWISLVGLFCYMVLEGRIRHRGQHRVSLVL